MLAESPFSPTLPTFQTTWDSTSLGWYKKCPRYYQYCMLGGWISRNKSIHLLFGGWYASGVERYAHARADGRDHISATRKMVRWVLEASGTRACGQCKGSGVLLHGDVVNDCPTCDGTGEGVEFIPWDSGDTTKNRYTLVRSLVWNVEDRLGTPFQTMILSDGRPAVELSFQFPLFELNGEVIHYAGHMDEVVEFEGRAWVKDDKTTKNALDANYRQQFSPDNQMTGYTVAGKVVLHMPIEGVLVRATQVGVNFNRFTTFPVPRPQAVLDEWTIDAQIVIRRAREDAERGYWPMNDKACLSGNTVIKVSRGTMLGRKTTLAKFHRFVKHGVGRHKYDHAIDSFALSDVGGYVGLNKIEDILEQGIKPVIRLATDTREIYATEDHRFNTPEGWKRLDELQPGDPLFVWNGIKGSSKGRAETVHRFAIGRIPFHPFKQRSCGRVWRSRIVVEAAMNKMSFDEYVGVLRFDAVKAKTLQYLGPETEVHHEDGNPQNDELSNLTPLPWKEHQEHHKETFVENTNRLNVEDVLEIQSAGSEMTYDLSMAVPHHNFIANDFVAHNCFGCEFRKVCTVSKTHRDAWLKDDFIQRPRWNPLEVRGDV